MGRIFKIEGNQLGGRWDKGGQVAWRWDECTHIEKGTMWVGDREIFKMEGNQVGGRCTYKVEGDQVGGRRVLTVLFHLLIGSLTLHGSPGGGGQPCNSLSSRGEGRNKRA